MRIALHVVRCPWSARRYETKGLSDIEAIRVRFHFVCANDGEVLRIRLTGSRTRIRTLPCPTCGAHPYGPTVEELLPERRFGR